MNDKTAKIEFSIQLEAKACPFCGSFNLQINDANCPIYVICGNCNSTGPCGPSYSEAIERWNERKAPTLAPAEEAK